MAMEYFPYQQVHQLPQTTYNSAYEDPSSRFQQFREMTQFPFQGHRWVDPYGRGSLLQAPRTETKPRLSKGEVEQLEAEFQKNNKPSSSLKKGLAEQMRVDVARINNWFQNRRAKKKQELKALEQQANSKVEKERSAPPTSPEQTATSPIERGDDPATFQTPVKTEPSHSPSPGSDVASVQPGAQQSQGADSIPEYPTDAQLSFLAQGAPTLSYTSDSLYNFSAAHDPRYFADLLAVSSVSSDQLATAAPAPMPCALDESDSHLNAFAFPMLMFNDNGSGLPPASGRMEIKEESPMAYPELGTIQQTIESSGELPAPEPMNQPAPLSKQPTRLKSPPAIDLAGRRKRPGLALSNLRSISNGPATGIDFGRRGADPGSPMRRVASATGFGPQGIRRFPTHHRGGLQERRQESLLHVVRSPSVASPFHASMAPPTPDTPVLGSQQSLREATVSSNSSEDDGSYLMFPPPDPTGQHSSLDQSLRTPPATPLNFGDVFSNSIGGTLGFSRSDEAHLTPGMEAYSIAGNEFSLPHYVADGYISQPSTPGVASQMSLATGYYAAAMSGGHNTEYNWSDTSIVSSKSPLNPSQRPQLQFNNFTAQDFSSDK